MCTIKCRLAGLLYEELAMRNGRPYQLVFDGHSLVFDGLQQVVNELVSFFQVLFVFPKPLGGFDSHLICEKSRFLYDNVFT